GMNSHAQLLGGRTPFGGLLLRTDLRGLNPIETRIFQRLQDGLGYFADNLRFANTPAKGGVGHRETGQQCDSSDGASTGEKLTAGQWTCHKLLVMNVDACDRTYLLGPPRDESEHMADVAE